MRVSIRPKHFGVLALACVMAASSGSGRPGFYEYWKAGTKRKGSGSTPSESRTSRRAPAPPASRAPTPPKPWTEAWFSDPNLVGEHIGTMTEAILVPMIGERFPLPRGGGFACDQVESEAPPATAGPRPILECTGPELGGERWNEFYSATADAPPTLERVRWRIRASEPTPTSLWRGVVTALRDSLSASIGEPAWIAPDSLGARWDGEGYRTTLRLHATTNRPDSIEITCVSDRLHPD